MSPREQQLLQVVAQDLQQDYQAYQQLLPLMQELYRQLLQRNSQQIDQLNAQINLLLEPTRQRAERRSKVLQALALGQGPAAMTQLFTRYAASVGEPLRQQWQQLGEWAGQCKVQNERNGKLLAMQNEIISQLLSEPDRALLYNQVYF